MFLVDVKTIPLKILISAEDVGSDNPWTMVQICEHNADPRQVITTGIGSKLLHEFDITINYGKIWEALMPFNNLLENAIKNMCAEFFLKGFEEGEKLNRY